MIKITIKIKQKGENTSVEIEPQKNLEKSSKEEKASANVIFNTINEALSKLNGKI